MLRFLTAGSACALSACTVCLPCVRHSQNKFKLEMNKENFKGFFSARYYRAFTVFCCKKSETVWVFLFKIYHS